MNITTKNRKPLISVCMPMYNASKFLRECMDSVLAQTFGDFEFLIVDDGSTDGSVEIVRSYHGSRIRLIRNRHDYIGSLNMLLDEARGKYIARMDADDVMMPERLQVQYDFMEAHVSVGVLASSAVYWDTGLPVCEYEKALTVANQDLLYANPLIHPTTIIRTSVLKKNGIRYEREFELAEDYRLWTVCAMHHIKISIIQYAGIKYRTSKSQVSYQHKALMKKSADKVKKTFSRWLCRRNNVAYKKPIVSETDNLLTVIIPFLNEGGEVVETVKSLRANVGNAIDIIVINDFSTDEHDYQSLLSSYDVYYILNDKRLGVAASRDYGVALCKTPYFLLLDAHMRVYGDRWLFDIVNMLKEDDRILLCAQTKQLWKNEEGRIVELKNAAPVYGAYATFDKGHLSPGIEWNYIQKDYLEKIQPIACVLGAGYATSKRYWMYLRGLEGLKLYGCDEVYISFKVWLEGGKCVLLKEHSFGHIYRNNAPYKITQSSFVFNYLLVAYTLFPDAMWYWVLSCCKIARPADFREAWGVFVRNKKKINELKSYYSKIATVSHRRIIRMNKLMGKQRVNDLSNREQVADLVFRSILQKTTGNSGIVEGKMAALIWLSRWDKENKKHTKELRQSLLEEIKGMVLSHQLPFNFRNGLCGIGWGLLYLYSSKLLCDIDECLLSQIDADIQTIDVANLSDLSLHYGVVGIIAYVVCREFVNRYKGLPSPFGARFIQSVKIVEERLLQNGREHLSVYYSYLHKNIDEIDFMEDFVPQLSDWITYPVTNPCNPKYWTYRLDNGCLGYTIAAF